jgi:SHS2 domain-containing protein
MRNRIIVSEDRGGTLTKENHQALMNWSIRCTEHVMIHASTMDERFINAINAAKKWMVDTTKTGLARKTAQEVQEATREIEDELTQTIAKSIEYTASTAHIASLSIEAAIYALKAAQLAGIPIEEEKLWQITKLNELTILPPYLIEFITTSIENKLKEI